MRFIKKLVKMLRNNSTHQIMMKEEKRPLPIGKQIKK